MAMAMVSTPDAAMDIFRDCWDKQADKDLYQAYQRLSSTTPTTSYSKPVVPTTVQQTTYIPITTSYIPTPVYCTTIGGSFQTSPSFLAFFLISPYLDRVCPLIHCPSSNRPSSTGIPTSYTTPSTSSYIPQPCHTPPSYAGGSSTPSQCSPHSCGSEGSRDQYEGSAGAATSEVTKIALMLISQSNKKVGFISSSCYSWLRLATFTLVLHKS